MHLKNRRYAFSPRAHVYCLSGYWSVKYKNMYRALERDKHVLVPVYGHYSAKRKEVIMEPTKMEYTVVSADDEVNAISACVEIIERHCSNELTTNNFDAGKVYNVVNYLYTRYRLEASD